MDIYYQKSLWLLLEKYMDTTRKKMDTARKTHGYYKKTWILLEKHMGYYFDTTREAQGHY